MIQRIQTIYLLLVAILNLVVIFLPLAVVQSGADFFNFDASGMSTMTTGKELVYPTWALMALSAIITILAFITIFMFKKRMFQIRLCIFNTILILGFYALFAFFMWKIAGVSEPFHFRMQIALALPLISLIFNGLAIRNIGIDEAMVRSLDRLR